MKPKHILPWVGLIVLGLGCVAGYADLQVKLSKLEKIASIERRLSMHWCIMMGNHEELHQWSDDPEKWSEHLRHCDSAMTIP